MVVGSRRCAPLVLLALLALVTLNACSGTFSRKYEYEEDVYLRIDGSATIYVNASVPALVALRGASLPLDPLARLDRQDVRALYESRVSDVASVTLSRRDNRRYVHVRITVADIRRLSQTAPFAWSAYHLSVGPEGDLIYEQNVSAATGREVGEVGWTGSELVAFRLHLPSRVLDENSETGNVERGNIVAWEQPLRARVRGEPINIRAVMERDSILAKTLTLFALMVVLVGLTFAVVVWLIVKRGRADADGADDLVQPSGSGQAGGAGRAGRPGG
ncbi:MAG: hypothetical protein LC791_02685 [Acidobacteria bacterium]|nr:hypothetical protein [Acidobacteriota bacterium]